MSSFAPQSFDEAKATFRPLRRSQMKRQSDSPLRKLKASPSPLSARKAQNSAGRPKAKRAKKLSTGKIKKKAWTQFSIFIRTRGADSDGFNSCFTCDTRKHYKELEAGHLVPGRTNAVLFSEVGVNPQCRRCNGHFRGNTIIYYPKMVRLYGQEVVDKLIAAKDETRKWNAGELQELFERYKAINKANPLTKKEE